MSQKQTCWNILVIFMLQYSYEILVGYGKKLDVGAHRFLDKLHFHHDIKNS